MRHLCVDFGTVRIGIAISDSDGRVAMPLCQFRNEGDGKAAQRVAELATENRTEIVVVGLPLNMDGSEGRAARRVGHFTARLRRLLEIPVVTEDERLSTTAAIDALDGAFKGAARAERLDAVAAQMILQKRLDAARG
ncbi:MAG TPA: Holliday junction resolvase RuvX [Candidatus Brocadiia bacterium]|nr:Holliday junction resolvase RuvX [Candidatus Brocadiia bacterium]